MLKLNIFVHFFLFLLSFLLYKVETFDSILVLALFNHFTVGSSLNQLFLI